MHNPFRLRNNPPVPRLRDAADAFAASTRRRQITAQRLDAYRLVLGDFAVWAGPDRRMSDIAPDEADAYARRIPHYLAAATYADKISALRTTWATLLPNSPNPWLGIQRRPADSRPREPLTRAEIDAVVAMAARHGRNGPELAMLIRIGAWTGLRLGDAVRLRWDAVGAQAITLRTRKTGSEVVIPILTPLRAALDAWRCAAPPRRPDSAVCPRLAAAVARNHEHTCNIAQQICLCMRRCGIETSYAHDHTARRRPLRGYHSLRHTYVTALLEAGIPMDIVAALVGHASMRMTAHYTHARLPYILDALANSSLIAAPPAD